MNATRDASSTDPTQVPIPQARVDFYLQGADVAVAVTISAGGSSSVTLFGVGALFEGALVRGGGVGQILTVTSLDSPTQVTLHNPTAAAVPLAAGTRLVVISGRPTAYADAFGVVSLGSAINTDSGGHGRVFLPEGEYDYIVTDPSEPVVANLSAAGTLITGSNTFNWSYTVTSGQTLLLVAISWQDSLGSDTLDTVAYGSQSMTRLGSAHFADLFYLLNPTVGSHSIVVTFSGTNTKAAVGYAIGLSHAHATAPISTVHTANGPGTTGGVTGVANFPAAWGFAVLGVTTVSGTTTVTLNTGPTSLWNQSIGSTGALDRTQAAGASRTSPGSAVDITWAISPSRDWGSVSAEVIPAFYSLVTSATTTESCQPTFGILATAYVSLQAAIDALPNQGGIVYVPSGTYLQKQGLLIQRGNVTLMGEGSSTVITPADPVNCPIDLLTISAPETRLVGLRFDGAASSQNLSTGTSCIVIDGLGVSGRLPIYCYFENVVATGAARFGVWMRDAIVLTAINCAFNENKGTGLRIEATDSAGGGSNAIRFYDCSLSANDAIGADIGADPPLGGYAGITFMGCVFEGNLGTGVTATDVGLGINAFGVVRIDVLSCYFEVPSAEDEQIASSQFVFLQDCGAATVDNCWFTGHAGEDTQPLYAARYANCPFARFSNNAVSNVASQIAWFDSSCLEAIEFGNRDFNTPASGVNRIKFDGPRAISMSRRSVSVPSHLSESTLPVLTDNLTPGAMVWVNSPNPGHEHLQIWDGSSWRGIAVL